MLHELKRAMLKEILLKTQNVARSARIAGLNRTDFYDYLSRQEIAAIRLRKKKSTDETATKPASVLKFLEPGALPRGPLENMLNQLNLVKLTRTKTENRTVANDLTRQIERIERNFEDYIADRLAAATLTSPKK